MNAAIGTPPDLTLRYCQNIKPQQTLTMLPTDLLDRRDPTLAFAAFGAAHYDSFPIAILQVAAEGDADEYLLCYHGNEPVICLRTALLCH